MPTGPRGRAQLRAWESMAWDGSQTSQVESFQMPHDSAWPSAAARGGWCLRPAPSRQLAAETHWLELKAAQRYSGGFSRLLPKGSTLMASGWQTGQVGHLRQPGNSPYSTICSQVPASTLTSQAFPCSIPVSSISCLLKF